ncbi:MAG: TrfB-related DNA-binding protein [Burkholderia gladioli]
MRAKRRMTGPEFEAIRPLLNISEDRMKAARMAIVDGQTLQGVANIFGWSRQAVGDAVSVVWRTFERYHESQRVAASAGTLLPPGWEQVTLIAPSHLITKFRAEIAQASPQPEGREAKKTPAKRAAKEK